jgi:hypothetical protein
MNPDVLYPLIPIAAIVMGGLVIIAKYFAHGGRQESTKAPEGRLEALETELLSVKNELGEVQERLDFTERVLSRSRDAKHLDAPD